MPTKDIHPPFNTAGAIELLQSIDDVTRLLKHADRLSAELGEAYEIQRAELEMALPDGIRDLLRGRLKTGQQLAAPVKQGRCSLCHARLTPEAQRAVRTRLVPVSCPTCGVLLFAPPGAKGLIREGGA